MKINLPYKVRFVLYVLTGVTTPLIAFLAQNGTIGDDAVTLWSAEVAFVSLLASLNTKE